MDKEFERRKKVIHDLIHDPSYTPMKIKELAIFLNVSKEDRPILQAVLDELVSEGKIGLSKRGKYGKAENTALIGVFSATQKGFGFVTIEGDEENDIFISEKDVNGAMHGDKVSVIVTRQKEPAFLPQDFKKHGSNPKGRKNPSKPVTGTKRREGRIIAIVERGMTEVVGLYEDNGNYGFVLPDNQHFAYDIFVAGKDSMGAQNGHKVVVKLTDYGDEKRNPEGVITKILGHKNDPGTDILSIVEGYKIPTEYPDDVMEQVAKIPNEVDPEEIQKRKDLRDVMMVTIDSESAKDLDDAVSLTKENGIYHLGVHIADVSQYVTEKSPLDQEALKRGTSVYLVDRVIPMLPHKLSNGLCSLNEGEDRLALSCLMDIDEKGNVIGHEIAETVIRTNARMTYTSVNKILTENDEEEIQKYRELVPMFRQMGELSDLLREKRHMRGSIDFDLPESYIVVDEKGKAFDIRPYERNKATMLIEDFMLIANETVAEDYFWQELPFVYRTHEKPDIDKIRSLSIFINNFGYSMHISDNEVHPMELQKLLAKVEGSDEEAMINRLTLRSMARAKYSNECTGHFGLAAKYYCHFTSPIRRYPDLQIHRIIKENLRGNLTEKRIEHYNGLLSLVCTQTSSTERRADDAERDVVKMKKAEYMRGHIGEEFEGVISGVTSWGVYVELPNTVEGMVHVNDMHGDHFRYDESRHQMIGEHTKKKYQLGQKVKVVCTGTDKLLAQINFQFSDTDEES